MRCVSIYDEVNEENLLNKTSLDYWFRLTWIVPSVPLRWINIDLTNPSIHDAFTDVEDKDGAHSLLLISNVL